MRTYPLVAPERIFKFWNVPVHTTSSFDDGEEVPIPILPVERVVFIPSILVPKMRFPILRVLLLEIDGVSILYPRTILFDQVVRVSATWLPISVLLDPFWISRPARYPKSELFDEL
mgnify:CR=1 FL=1